MKQEQKDATVPVTKRRKSSVHSAKEKAQAVLSLWSGRRNTASLTRTLDVPWAVVHTWEKKALTGMLTALDPSWKKPEEGQLNLPRRLEKLIGQTVEPASEELTATK